MNPKTSARLEKLTIVLSAIGLLICDAALKVFADRHSQSLSGLSHFWLVNVAATFALLWIAQFFERGKAVCMACTGAASLAAVGAIIMTWPAR